MNARRRSALEKLDALVRWTNASETVKRDMSSDGDAMKRHRPRRWLPLVPMACGAGLVFAAIALRIPHTMYGMAGAASAGMAAIHANGPLGKSSVDDDEREGALRKDAFLFCLSVLGFLNIVGQPILMLMAALHGWATERVVGIVFAMIIGNLTWFTSLPTLYVSWKLPKLAEE